MRVRLLDSGVFLEDELDTMLSHVFFDEESNITFTPPSICPVLIGVFIVSVSIEERSIAVGTIGQFVFIILDSKMATE